MDNPQKRLFTIGYSGFTLTQFVSRLKQYHIGIVVDVRSTPYSKFRPEFNRENLENGLTREQVDYVWMGDSLGARVDDPTCYRDGRADYSLIAGRAKFQEGIELIRKWVSKCPVVLLCAEKDPIQCHRMILICRNIHDNTIRIDHILDNQEVQTQHECEKRLLMVHKLNQYKIFGNSDNALEHAYDLQGQKIAYKPGSSTPGGNEKWNR